ncbi:MAG: NUDIX hydrolase [Clostridiaceae bacterium]|nr:NUDIX hydrolase [Clostridiaceae bacterium]
MNYYEKTVNEERKYTGNIINVDKVTVVLPDGRESTRDVVRHPGASVILPITDDGKIIMVEQYRKPCEMISLELPAGKLDAGEPPEECAKRELQEETGYIAGKLAKVLTIHSTPGFSDEVLHMFVATDLVEKNAHPDEDEFISCRKYDISELISMVEKGEITDAKTIIGIFLADRIIKGEHKLS